MPAGCHSPNCCSVSCLFRPVEHLDGDFAAWIDIISVLRDDGEAVGFGEGGEKLRALFAGETCGVAVVVALHDDAHELAAAVVLHAVEEAGLNGGLVEVRVPLHDEERRADEFLESDISGDRVAGQADDGHATAWFGG